MLYSIRSVRKAAQLYNRRNLSTFTKLDYIETVPKRNRIELTLRGVHVFFTTLYRNTQTGVEKKKKKCARNLEKSAYQMYARSILLGNFSREKF